MAQKEIKNKEVEDKKFDFALGFENYKLLLIGFAIIIL